MTAPITKLDVSFGKVGESFGSFAPPEIGQHGKQKKRSPDAETLENRLAKVIAELVTIQQLLKQQQK